MKYAFEFRPLAQRNLRAIPQRDAIALLNALAALGDDPYTPNQAVKPMSGTPGQFRLRCGNYRAVYEIVDGRLIILVIDVGHRSAIYRRRT
ncbi:type II toxin-antitoxin system RelE/ParE family toxin [Nocardia sp. NPDC005366]|uniref:type II toxin-antitoxin system RelE family toxin n=1 Tax=Nocardia sp. NPDC005366 TaxID=3156878 RepID=UPI0033B8E39B